MAGLRPAAVGAGAALGAAGWGAAALLGTDGARAALDRLGTAGPGWKGVVAAAILAHAAWILCVVWAAGRLVGRRLLRGSDLSGAATLVLGAGAVGIAVGLLGYAGLLQRGLVFALCTGVCVFGLGPDDLRNARGGLQRTVRVMREHAWLALVLGLYVGPRMLEALVPNGQGDAHFYHLPSAWYWARAGRIAFVDWSPWMLQGGLFEYLYTLAALLTDSRMALLVEAQVLHAVFGLGVGSALLYRIARRLGAERPLALAATIVFITLAHDDMTLVRAKNDGFVLVAILACLDALIAYADTRDVRRLPVFYATAAVACAAKHTAAFFLIPAGLWLGWWLAFRERGHVRAHLKLAALAVPVALSTLARNLWLTGNPFFPAASAVFPSPYVDDVILAEVQAFTRSEVGPWAALWAQWRAFYGAKPALALAVLPLFPSAAAGWRVVYAVSAVGVLLLAAITGGGTSSFRFTFFLYATTALGATGVVMALRTKPWLGALLLVGLGLPASSYEVPASRLVRRIAPFYVSDQSFLEYLAEEKPLVRMYAWINDRYDSGHVLANTVSDSLLIRLPLSHRRNNVTASSVFKAQDLDEFARRFRAAGYTLLLRFDANIQGDQPPPFYGELDRAFAVKHAVGDIVLYELR